VIQSIQVCRLKKTHSFGTLAASLPIFSEESVVAVEMSQETDVTVSDRKVLHILLLQSMSAPWVHALLSLSCFC
jgi:hypothetical protein